MRQALQYINEKSDKFWRIETAGCEVVTNWSKIGTTGRYQMKNLTRTVNVKDRLPI